jgi:hypothetical protein
MSWIEDALNKSGGGATKENVKDSIRDSVKLFRSLGWDNADIEIFIVGQMGDKLGKTMAELIAKWLWEIFNEESGVQVQ